MPHSKQDLKDLIAKGHAADVLAGVIAVARDLRDTGRLHQSASLLSARWSANELAQQRGTVSNADYLLEKNKVTDTLLAMVGELPDGVVEVQLSESFKLSESSIPIPAKPPDLWKRIGYVALIVGILAGVVKIVEYFQKPSTTDPTEKTVAKPDSLTTPANISTSGDQSPAINAPGGDVQINYGSEPEKPAQKKE